MNVHHQFIHLALIYLKFQLVNQLTLRKLTMQMAFIETICKMYSPRCTGTRMLPLGRRLAVRRAPLYKTQCRSRDQGRSGGVHTSPNMSCQQKSTSPRKSMFYIHGWRLLWNGLVRVIGSFNDKLTENKKLRSQCAGFPLVGLVSLFKIKHLPP